jgi:hypothetical protein
MSKAKIVEHHTSAAEHHARAAQAGAVLHIVSSARRV